MTDDLLSRLRVSSAPPAPGLERAEQAASGHERLVAARIVQLLFIHHCQPRLTTEVRHQKEE